MNLRPPLLIDECKPLMLSPIKKLGECVGTRETRNRTAGIIISFKTCFLANAWQKSTFSKRMLKN
jgi:hypothetical protein